MNFFTATAGAAKAFWLATVHLSFLSVFLFAGGTGVQVFEGASATAKQVGFLLNYNPLNPVIWDYDVSDISTLRLSEEDRCRLDGLSDYECYPGLQFTGYVFPRNSSPDTPPDTSSDTSSDRPVPWSASPSLRVLCILAYAVTMTAIQGVASMYLGKKDSERRLADERRRARDSLQFSHISSLSSPPVAQETKKHSFAAIKSCSSTPVEKVVAALSTSAIMGCSSEPVGKTVAKLSTSTILNISSEPAAPLPSPLAVRFVANSVIDSPPVSSSPRSHTIKVHSPGPSITATDLVRLVQETPRLESRRSHPVRPTTASPQVAGSSTPTASRQSPRRRQPKQQVSSRPSPSPIAAPSSGARASQAPAQSSSPATPSNLGGWGAFRADDGKNASALAAGLDAQAAASRKVNSAALRARMEAEGRTAGQVLETHHILRGSDGKKQDLGTTTSKLG